MKKISFVSVFILVVAYVISIAPAHATVGGPTYLYGLRTNGSPEILYITQDHGGKGCPAELHVVNTNTGTTRTVLSCDSEMIDGSTAYKARYDSILATYPTPLKRIHLGYNGFSAKVRVTKELPTNYDAGQFGGTEFSTDIYRAEKLRATLNYVGCKPDQVHIMEGYVVPNSTSIALILSTVRGCFEGGYTGESIHFVPNDFIGYEYSMPPRTDNTPVVADADGDNGALIAYAKTDTKGTQNDEVPSSDNESGTQIPLDQPVKRPSLYQLLIDLLF